MPGMRQPAELRRALSAVALLLIVACSGLDPSGLQHVSSTPASPATGPPEYRALWVDAFHEGIHSRTEIDRLIATAQRARLNTLFVQVRKAGDAYYSKSLEPRAWDIFAPASFDPLAYLLSRAHAASPRLEVHAWVNTFYVGRRSRVMYEHGSDWGNRTRDGSPGAYLDPGNAAAREYTLQVLLKLVGSYDLDGLHLDFVRYPEGGDWGYSPAAVAAFDAASGRTDVPDPADEAWKQWRRDQVTALIRDLYRQLGERRSRARLSAALIPWGAGPVDDAGWRQTSAYEQVFQDWNAWLKEGILDLAVPMNYDTAWAIRPARWFEQWIEWEKDNQRQRRIVIGVGAYFNYPEDTLAQIRRALAPSARGNRAAGVAIYSYASTSLYGTDDYYRDPDAAAALPRQPYAAGLDSAGLAARAGRFNAQFWSLLSTPGSYTDPAQGRVDTQPVFTRAAPVPSLPWKRP